MVANEKVFWCHGARSYITIVTISPIFYLSQNCFNVNLSEGKEIGKGKEITMMQMKKDRCWQDKGTRKKSEV